MDHSVQSFFVECCFLATVCMHPNFALVFLYLHQIHVILVSIAVVKILCVCSEVMAILNVPVIQVSSEMGKTTANTTSGFTEAFFNSSTLNRQAHSILFLAIVGEQNTSTYIMNNAVGDIRTTGTFSVSHTLQCLLPHLC